MTTSISIKINKRSLQFVYLFERISILNKGFTYLLHASFPFFFLSFICLSLSSALYQPQQQQPPHGLLPPPSIPSLMSQPPPGGMPPPIMGSYPSSQQGSYSQPPSYTTQSTYTQSAYSQPSSGGPGFNQPQSSAGGSWGQVAGTGVGGGSVSTSRPQPLMSSKFRICVFKCFLTHLME